jgi:hypothetical protein
MADDRPGRFHGNEHAFHQTENYPGVRGFIARTEGDHFVVYDGLGNKTWFVDSTAATATLTLPPAKAEFGKFHTIVQTAGANPILTAAASGNVVGTPTYSASTAFFRLVSDGTNFFRCG